MSIKVTDATLQQLSESIDGVIVKQVASRIEETNKILREQIKADIVQEVASRIEESNRIAAQTNALLAKIASQNEGSGGQSPEDIIKELGPLIGAVAAAL